MQVFTVLCVECQTRVFSRAPHDYRSCPCGHVAVDGGQSCPRVVWKGGEIPPTGTAEISQTKKELYDDWNLSLDKFGYLPPGTLISLL